MAVRRSAGHPSLAQPGMAEPATTQPRPSFEDPHVDYQTVEPWAVVGVILGLAASSAMLGGVFWLFAALGIAVNLIALARLKANTHRSGRGAALLGLALSVVFAVAPLAQAATSRWMLTEQARPVATQFLEFLRENSPEKAMNLRFTPDRRLPFDDELWTLFRHDAEAKKLIRKFVDEPAVRTLLALGTGADVRFYKTAGVATGGNRAVANLIYTVTFTDASDDKQTFFVSVALERKPTMVPDVNPWRIMHIAGGFDPNNPSAAGEPD